LNLIDRFKKNTEISNFMKMHPEGVELFHAEGQTHRQMDGRNRQTDRQDEAYSNFSQVCERASNCDYIKADIVAGNERCK
jgi:hypothetical protein